MGRSDQKLLAQELPCFGEKKTSGSSQLPIWIEVTLEITKPGNRLHRRETPSARRQSRAGQIQNSFVLGSQSDRSCHREGLTRWPNEQSEPPRGDGLVESCLKTSVIHP